MPVSLLVPLPIKPNVPANAPTLIEFTSDTVLYFLIGDFISYSSLGVFCGDVFSKGSHYGDPL
jgi:hypothetical protein